MKTLFVDDWYIDTRDGLERHVQPADLLPILPWKGDASLRRYAYDIEDIRIESGDALCVRIHAHNNGAKPLHFWLKSEDGKSWEDTSDPPNEVRASGSPGLRVLPKNTLVGPRTSDQLRYRLYDRLRDGPVDLQQVEVWKTPSRRSRLGGIDVPPRSRVAVWKRPDGVCLLLGDPTKHPIITDKWRFKKDDPGTWRDSNDNFGPLLMSADNRTLRFFQTRSIPRNEPYRVFYDNIFVDRIMTSWSSSDGIHWSPTFFEIPDARHGSPGLQHYGVYLFPEENAALQMAYVRMYDAVSQKTHTDVAYSRDGVLWNRLKELPPFLSTGPLGSWNYGFCYPGNHRIRLENDGMYYEPINGDDILHFMKLPVWGKQSRDHVTVQTFHERSNGRLVDPEKGIPSTDIWQEYGKSWQNIVDATIASTRAPGLMRFRKDGWVALTAGPECGLLTTKVLRAGGTVSLNGKTHDSGLIKVEVLDADGREMQAFCADNAAVFTGDATESQLKWSNSSVSVLPDTPLRLRISVQNAKLYSLVWSAPARPTDHKQENALNSRQ